MDAHKAQQNEINGYRIYKALAKRESGKNKHILEQIANDELRHYKYWKTITKKDCKPRNIWFDLLLMRVFGTVFMLKLMERREQNDYKGKHVARNIAEDERRHEEELLSMYNDERLEYAGSVVLGLNDALVELTGVLAGLTLALSNKTLIVIAAFITGFAAALSMAASAYFAAKEESTKDHFKVATYTGITYIGIVIVLIVPYLFFSVYASLALSLTLAILIIAVYTLYISIAKSIGFWKRFIEMALVSLGIAFISFLFGWLLNHYFGV